MLSLLAEYEHAFGPLRLFRFISVRSVGGAGTALLLGLLLGPWLINRLRMVKAAQSFRAAAEVGKLADLHAGKQGTPTMGGLLIWFSVLVSGLLWAEANTYVLVTLSVFTALTALGFADDYLKISRRHSGGLPGRIKLLAQALITAGALAWLLADPTTASHVRELWVPFYKEPIWLAMPLAVVFIFLFLVLAGSSNALNLTDGVDGLAIGCTLTVGMAYGIMSYATGNAIYADYLLLKFLPGTGELTIICAILCAASLAFLWYNAHPAAVFMGDTGSLALGGILGIIAFLILQPITLIIVGAVFVAEAVSVILQVGSFKSTGKRIFRMAPIHHHFELGGWAETQVVIRFWIISLVCAFAGLATLKIR